MQADNKIIQGFSAKKYRFLKWINGVAQIQKEVVKEIKLRENDSLLDIGCGHGDILRKLHKKFKGTNKLFGIDASGDMIIEAKGRSEETGIQYKVAYAEDLPYGNDSFDWVISVLTAHHIAPQNKEKFVNEIKRVLKPKGKALIVDIGRPNNFIGRIRSFFSKNHHYTKNNMEIIEEVVKNSGFNTIDNRKQFGYMEHLLIEKL